MEKLQVWVWRKQSPNVDVRCLVLESKDMIQVKRGHRGRTRASLKGSHQPKLETISASNVGQQAWIIHDLLKKIIHGDHTNNKGSSFIEKTQANDQSRAH